MYFRNENTTQNLNQDINQDPSNNLNDYRDMNPNMNPNVNPNMNPNMNPTNVNWNEPNMQTCPMMHNCPMATCCPIIYGTQMMPYQATRDHHHHPCHHCPHRTYCHMYSSFFYWQMRPW